MIVWRVPLERAERTDWINVKLMLNWVSYLESDDFIRQTITTLLLKKSPPWITTTSWRPMRENIWNLTLSSEYIFVARVRNFKYERANLRLRSRSFYILYSIIQFTCTLTYLLWFFIWSNRGMHQAQTIGKPRNEFWSSLFLEICKGKIKLTLLLPVWKIIPCEVLHLSSKSLVVSYQVHGNNISRHKQKN